MLAVGGSFKLLSAVAFFFAWKYYKLPSQCQPNGDLNPETASSETTITDGNARKNTDTELIPVAQFITVSDSQGEKTLPDKEYSKTTNV